MKRFKKRTKRPDSSEPQDSYSRQELVCPNCGKVGQLYISQSAYHAFNINNVDKDGDIEESDDSRAVDWADDYTIICDNCTYETYGEEIYKATMTALTTKKST